LKKNLKRLAGKETNLQDQHLQNLKTKTSRPNQRLGEGIIELDKEKLEKALEEEKVVKKRKMFRKDTMTEEELEAYRMTRHRADDPMAKYIDSERNK
jgi:pre-mRNA-processing factor SLU7